tara:strand:+ start:259 stop:402 length:144 start_codon:yes stop_codon:yes gene_type:complete
VFQKDIANGSGLNEKNGPSSADQFNQSVSKQVNGFGNQQKQLEKDLQ